MKSRYKNIIYFQNGSIGDFLMAVFFLENIHLNDDSVKINIVVPRFLPILRDVVSEYPFINVIVANKRSLSGLFGALQLLKFFFSKNLVITAPTPGTLSSSIKIIAKIISTTLVGFDDGQEINKSIYNKLLDYDTSIIYPEFLKTVIKKLGFEVKKEVPRLKCSKDESVLGELGLKKDKYIVFSPIAATKGRSFKESEIVSLIEKIPDMKFVLVGGGADRHVLETISLTFKDRVVVLVNPNLSKLCALVKNSKLFIGVDTGTSHIVSFLGKKSLVVAQNGTPNWLPYYNSNATVLYTIKHCKHSIFEGREHLESCRGDVLRCLGYVPMEIIGKYLDKEML